MAPTIIITKPYTEIQSPHYLGTWTLGLLAPQVRSLVLVCPGGSLQASATKAGEDAKRQKTEAAVRWAIRQFCYAIKGLLKARDSSGFEAYGFG